MLRRFLQTDDDFSATVLRVVLGIAFIPHGAQKVFGLFGGYGPSATIQGFSKMGIPPALTVVIMAAEMGGAILLILGLFTRLAALGIGCVMVGAVLLVHGKVGFFMNWSGKQLGEGFEYHLIVLAVVVALLVKGGGALSVDRALTREGGRTAPLPAP
jgi:putative oxidoreductase